MKFRFEGSKIVCSRVHDTDGGQQLDDVVEFDAHLDIVSAHVAARLTTSEKQQLERFLADKQRLQSRSTHRLILEALPGLIDKVRGVLDSADRIDESLHRQMTEANKRLGAALGSVCVEHKKPSSQVGGRSQE
jgi:hypothetical protein